MRCALHLLWSGKARHNRIAKSVCVKMADAISAHRFDVGLFPAQFEHRMLRQQVGEAIGARLVSRQKPLAFNLDIPFV